MLVNEGLPNFIVNQLRQQQKLRDKVVAVLGMAFKSESDDKRESLSYKLRKLLMVEAKEVLCTDPYVVDPKAGPAGGGRAIVPTSSFWGPSRRLPRPSSSDDKVVVDVWGFWPNRQQTVTGGHLAS